ncbi:MAG: metallophosphoesterase [Clostridia bacterium]|nr:metallophosphoesterase [Clostridia bacterium]
MKDHRFLFFSDTHYDFERKLFDGKGYQYDYGDDADNRMESLLALITEEHKIRPFDAIFLLGDNTHERYENVEVFMKRYVSRFPCPTYLIPGNHEGHSNDLWRAAVGQDRQYTVDIDDCRFLMLDAFWEITHPHRLQPPDWEFLRTQTANTDGMSVFLCAHMFQYEDETLAQWLLEHREVVAVFHGHSHNSFPIVESFGGKKVISSGNYSYALTMSEIPMWPEKWGWSVTELSEESGVWRCRKIFPTARYPFSELTLPNRFCERIHCDYNVEKHYGEWESLITDIL